VQEIINSTTIKRYDTKKKKGTTGSQQPKEIAHGQ